ncbi:hypothetical protein J4234_00270 [Candidatus Woesearchaeota archaeon]|nr:hypothetical protein [Candidatus Woesearchaeota archaeon]
MRKDIYKRLYAYAKEAKDSDLNFVKGDKSFQILKLIIDDIKEKYNLSPSEILSLIEEKPISKEILIPVSIFEAENLSALEAVCKYLKEDLDINYSKIASLLNRNSRTIWTTYNNAVKKREDKLPAKESKFFIPVSAFTDRKFSVLESIVCYLKDKFNLRYSEIAVLLKRDERNIWTVYNNYKKKNE